MSKRNIILNVIFIIFLLNNCTSKFEKRIEFDNEFKNYVINSDSLLYDQDPLHPTYAFLKNGKIIALEFNGNGECGKTKRRYYINESEKIDKIVYDKSFNNNCEKAFDSIYIIKPAKNKIIAYSNTGNGKKVNYKKLMDNYLIIDIEEYKLKIKNWHYR